MEQELSSPNDQEKKEQPPVRIELVDLTELSGVSLSALAASGEQYLLERIQADPDMEKWIRHWLSLPKSTPIVEALHHHFETKPREYTATLERRLAGFQAQAQRCVDAAREHGWLQWEKPLRIILTDQSLKFGLYAHGTKSWFNQYVANEDAVYVDIQGSHRLLVHELGHLLSTNVEKRLTPFGQLKLDEGQLRSPTELRWLEEGSTMIWEEFAVDDGSANTTIQERQTPRSVYRRFRQTTKLIMKQIGIDQDTLMRGYFGDTGVVDLVRQKVQERFGCTLEDLDCLMTPATFTITRRIVEGEPVSIKTWPDPNDEFNPAANNKEKLAKVFPNVTLVRVRA